MAKKSSKTALGNSKKSLAPKKEPIKKGPKEPPAAKKSKEKPATSKLKLPAIVPAPESPAPTRKKRAVKATPSKIASGHLLDPKPVIKEPIIPHEEISLRAYFIAERRQQMGWPGDPSTDWSDAVSQLRAEALEKPLKKR